MYWTVNWASAHLKGLYGACNDYKGILNFYATIKLNHSTKVEMLGFDFVRIKNQKRNSKLKMKFDIDIGRQKCKMENEI